MPIVQVFRDALRCIKILGPESVYYLYSLLHADASLGLERAIFSNANGFLGGVARALVARICHLYPNATLSCISGT